MNIASMTAEELNDALQDCLAEIKERCRRQAKCTYERWKAGGFLVDSDIISMYDNVYDVVEALQEDSEDEQDI